MAALFNALSARALLKAIALKLHAGILYHKLSKFKAASKLNGASNASASCKKHCRPQVPTPRLSISKQSKKSSKQPAAAAAMAQAPSPPPPARPGSPPGKGSTAELAGKLAISQPVVGVSMGQTVADVASSPGRSNPADLTGVHHLIALTLRC